MSDNAVTRRLVSAQGRQSTSLRMRPVSRFERDAAPGERAIDLGPDADLASWKQRVTRPSADAAPDDPSATFERPMHDTGTPEHARRRTETPTAPVGGRVQHHGEQSTPPASVFSDDMHPIADSQPEVSHEDSRVTQASRLRSEPAPKHRSSSSIELSAEPAIGAEVRFARPEPMDGSRTGVQDAVIARRVRTSDTTADVAQEPTIRRDPLPASERNPTVSPQLGHPHPAAQRPSEPDIIIRIGRIDIRPPSAPAAEQQAMPTKKQRSNLNAYLNGKTRAEP